MVFAAASCSLEDNFQRLERVEKEITIKAVREGDEAETRTYREDSDGSVWWVPGDAISLFYGSGADGGSKFTSVNTTDTTRVTNFTGVITAITGGGEIAMDQTYFWGFYPYQEDASCDGTGVTMTLPTKQTAVPGTFATNTFPSIGRSQGLVMGFYNICGGMKFSVTKEGIKRITLKSKGGEYVSGKAKVSFGEDGIPTAEIIDGSDEVVLEAPAGEYFIPGKFYFMVMFPTTFSQGFTLKFETFTEEASVEKGKVTVKRSIFGKIPNLDGSAAYSKKTGNIPIEDANFKASLVEKFDTDKDGEISYDEALEILVLGVNTDSITSVRGIEYMPRLQRLICTGTSNTSTSSGKLKVLDVSNNTELTLLACYNNQLTNLDISKNTALTYLSCFNNQLTGIDVSKNTRLTELYCQNNQLTSLDVSKNTALTCLSCAFNQLTSLDVSNNTAMGFLRCSDNQLTSLDVSKNLALSDLQCDENQLANLDVSENAALVKLYCYGNQLTHLDVSKSTGLTVLDCSDNRLTDLDASKNTALQRMYCNNNQLTSLDVSTITALTFLYCGGNQLTSLDVSKSPALTGLYCYNNQLTSLDVSKNTALTGLGCSDNQLTSLDVSKNTALTQLDCSPMDVDGVNQLTTLYISQGQEIPNVTSNRSVDYIPAETEIEVIPSVGSDSDYVDLGLPSGVKWAKTNIAVENGLFAWGEVDEKTRFSWGENYKWGGGGLPPEGSGTYLLKYNTKSQYGSVDNKTTLDFDDDVAHNLLGGKWRMPTYDDFMELIENCDWEQTSTTEFKLTSRINGNSIELPLVTGRYGIEDEGDGIARYWSSSLNENEPTQAWRFSIRSNEWIDQGVDMIYMAQDIRSAGFAIRPVYVE